MKGYSLSFPLMFLCQRHMSFIGHVRKYSILILEDFCKALVLILQVSVRMYQRYHLGLDSSLSELFSIIWSLHLWLQCKRLWVSMEFTLLPTCKYHPGGLSQLCPCRDPMSVCFGTLALVHVFPLHNIFEKNL